MKYWMFIFGVLMTSEVLFSQATPSQAPAESASGSTAMSPNLAYLLRLNLPLYPAQRQSIARELIQSGAWKEWSRQLGLALITDYRSGHVDQKPWIARLRLAQIFDWMGTPERDFAINFFPKLREQKTRVTPEVWSEVMKEPEGVKLLVSKLGDASLLPGEGLLAQRIKPETLVALIASEELMDQVGQAASAADYQPGLWQILADLQEMAPEKMADYSSLAVALAIVHNHAFPANWPHGQVARSALPLASKNWGPLFSYFTQSQDDGKLLTDLKNLRVDQLKYLVDVPLQISELEWAKQNVRASRSNFATVFPMIRYDHERLNNQVYNWPDKSYRLGEIKEKGGICVDQAYFATIAGKARGLPTLLFTGEGTSGGHAWFGFLIEDNKWVMNAARYKSENYVTGEVYDPQTWHLINDHELAYLSDPGESMVIYNYSRNIATLAQMPSTREDMTLTHQLLEAALSVNPRLPMVWEAVEKVLVEGKDQEGLVSHYQKMAEEFEKNEDVRAVALGKLLKLQRQLGRNEEAEKTQITLLNLRIDLALRAAFELVEAAAKAGDWEGSSRLYSKYLDFLGNTKGQEPGGQLFYSYVVPCINLWIQSGHKDLAIKAYDQTRGYFSQGSQSIVGQELESMGDYLKLPEVPPSTPKL